jgi:hypothetical protein
MFAAYLRARQRQYRLERRFPDHTFWARRTQSAITFASAN